jgi:hypothetical protein
MGYKRRMSLSLVAFVMLGLTGCLYPGDQQDRSQMATGEYIIIVQNAIETFKQRNGVLPIKNSTAETPIFEKYKIDFGKLLDYNLISRIPEDAYEGGGNNEYVIVDPEGELQVKLLDLVTAQQVLEVQRTVDTYQVKENKLPFGEMAKPHFYYIDFEALQIKKEQVRSIYSEMFLSLLLHESGRVAIDYAPEVMMALRHVNITEPDPTIDLRYTLTQQSPYIPVASYPYYWVDGEPVISER